METPTNVNGDGNHARRCAELKKDGTRCTAYALRGGDKCSGHAGITRLNPALAAQRSAEVRRQQAEERRELEARAVMGTRTRLAVEFQDRHDKLIAALDDALEKKNHAAIATYLNQAFGQPVEHVETREVTSVDDISKMSPAERAALKAKLRASLRPIDEDAA